MKPSKIVDSFPTTKIMKQRWTELAAAIAREVDTSGKGPAGERKGFLTVLGSGIGHTDLTIDTENQIKDADYVFYSINDYVTKFWLNNIRPDAYDLSILYNEMIDRHATYTRMAESLLHFVRRGNKVVAVFYGHPGIFATPGHRAIQIARKEGHCARMRPGISALDCLIADIGFDPALPGMVTYEATDMLLRRRRIDPTLHTVIWQVGVVGEVGYNRQGYTNSGFSVLIDALEEAYGPDWEVIHYIGAQYAGGEPRIERRTIRALCDVNFTKNLSTLSTFYINPKEVAATDPDRATALGLSIQSHQTSKRHGDYSRYGPRELTTLRQLSTLSFSSGYEVKECNPVLSFLMAISSDIRLRTRFENDPASVLDSPEFADLSEREKSLLFARNQRATVAAITGN